MQELELDGMRHGGAIVILTPSVEVKDISLTDYINVSHAVYVREWRTAARSSS